MQQKSLSSHWMQTGLITVLVATLALPEALLAEDERLIRRLGDGSVQTEDWLPENMDFNDLDQEDGDSESERTQLAEAAEADNILLGPEGAFALWLSLLNDNPQSDPARAGLNRVARRLEQRASETFSEADAEALRQLDFDYSRFSDVPVIAALRDRIQQQLTLLDNRPDADQIYRIEPLSEMLDSNRRGLSQHPELTWLQADLAILENQLRQVSQDAANAQDAAVLSRALEIAENNQIELSNQHQLQAVLDSLRWQQARRQISDWLDAEDWEQAQAELVSWDSNLPDWQALDLRAQHLAAISSLEVGERLELLDPSGLLPAMRYVGQVDGQHLVVAETEVSIGQFRRFAETTGYRSQVERGRMTSVFHQRSGETRESNDSNWRLDYRGRSGEDTLPVIHLTRADAQAFIDWLNDQTDLPLRLPSLAEFRHYAAAGSDTRFWWGNGLPDRVVENLAGEGDSLSANRRVISHPLAFAGYEDGYFGPAPVASFEANPFGLYDVLGNVSELTSDCADQSEPCRQVTVAGGHWHSAPLESFIDSWRAQPAERGSADIGFRLVMSL